MNIRLSTFKTWPTCTSQSWWSRSNMKFSSVWISWFAQLHCGEIFDALGEGSHQFKRIQSTIYSKVGLCLVSLSAGHLGEADMYRELLFTLYLNNQVTGDKRIDLSLNSAIFSSIVGMTLLGKGAEQWPPCWAWLLGQLYIVGRSSQSPWPRCWWHDISTWREEEKLFGSEVCLPKTLHLC